MAHRNHILSAQRGTAIIVALFVMSLVAAAAIAMMSRLNIDTRRTELLLNANKANLIAQGSIAWAMDQLNNNAKQQKPNQLMDRTPIHSKTDQVDGAALSSTIEDMQAYFNINNLATTDYQKNFLRLLQVVEPSLDTTTANNIILAIQDWITLGEKSGVYDAYYAGLNPPYRAPHRLMASASELRLVKGITPALYQKLKPYITALPVTIKININNAPPAVLMSLSHTLTAEAAHALVLYRRESPFVNTVLFLNFDIVKNNPIADNLITTTSNYFLVTTNVTVGQQHTTLNTLLLRTIRDTKPTVTVLWQTKGTL